MGKITLNDLLTFAKAGYSPKDVKDILSMNVPDNEHQGNEETPPQPAPTAPPVPTETPAEPSQGDPENAAKESANVKNPEGEPSQDSIDYKKKYEETNLLLQKLQAANAAKNAEDNNKMSAADALTESFRRLM